MNESRHVLTNPAEGVAVTVRTMDEKKRWRGREQRRIRRKVAITETGPEGTITTIVAPGESIAVDDALFKSRQIQEHLRAGTLVAKDRDDNVEDEKPSRRRRSA